MKRRSFLRFLGAAPIAGVATQTADAAPSEDADVRTDLSIRFGDDENYILFKGNKAIMSASMFENIHCYGDGGLVPPAA